MVITSKDNPNIKLLTKLLTSKKARNESGMFVLEGVRICVDTIGESLNDNMEIVAFFYTQEAEEKYIDYLNKSWIKDLDETKMFCITNELANKISSENTSQGVFVIAKKIHKLLTKNEINPQGKYVILNHLQDPGNVGTMLRTCDAVGAEGVILTNNCCDLYNPKVVRSTMGSLSRVNIFIENDFEVVCEILKEKNITTMAAVVGDGASVVDKNFNIPCAVVIGNEGNGLSEEDVKLCDCKITIKMNGNINSLNAAMAGTIIMWEMFRK
ncbi:MAG: RNA methyltransferase [Clostridiales bacterium]|nr:RNA methyltransferase [Clostridiales bacterium]